MRNISMLGLTSLSCGGLSRFKPGGHGNQLPCRVSPPVSQLSQARYGGTPVRSSLCIARRTIVGDMVFGDLPVERHARPMEHFRGLGLIPLCREEG
jgi:hypothetical protein